MCNFFTVGIFCGIGCITYFKIHPNELKLLKTLTENDNHQIQLARDKHKNSNAKYCIETFNFGQLDLTPLILSGYNMFSNCAGIVSRISNFENDSNPSRNPSRKRSCQIMLPFKKGTLASRIKLLKTSNQYFETSDVVHMCLIITEGIKTLHENKLMVFNNDTIDDADSSVCSSDDSDGFVVVPLDVLSPNPSPTQKGNYQLNSYSQPFIHHNINPESIWFNDHDIPEISELGFCWPESYQPVNRISFDQFDYGLRNLCYFQYTAPELHQLECGNEHNRSVDIWSLGCTMYTMLYLTNPFKRESVIRKEPLCFLIKSGTFSFPKWPEYPVDLKKLISSCLQVDSNNRPDISTVQQILAEISSAGY